MPAGRPLIGAGVHGLAAASRARIDSGNRARRPQDLVQRVQRIRDHAKRPLLPLFTIPLRRDQVRKICGRRESDESLAARRCWPGVLAIGSGTWRWDTSCPPCPILCILGPASGAELAIRRWDRRRSERSTGDSGLLLRDRPSIIVGGVGGGGEGGGGGRWGWGVAWVCARLGGGGAAPMSTASSKRINRAERLAKLPQPLPDVEVRPAWTAADDVGLHRVTGRFMS